AVRVLEEPRERLVAWKRAVAEELGAEHFDSGARGADADLAVRRGQRLEQPCRVGGAGGAGDAEEHVHSPGFSLLVRALGGLEEDRELAEARVAERRKGRHRRPRAHAGRALEVVDLELDAEIARA